MIKDYFSYALRNLKYRQLRSWLTILGIVIGIAAIVGLIQLGEGMDNAINEQFQKLGINSIRVVPKGFTGPMSGSEGLTESDVKVIEKIPGVDYAESILFKRAEVEFSNEIDYMQVTGTPISQSEKVVADLDLTFESGRRFQQGEMGVVMIGYNIAHEKFDKDVAVRNGLIIEGKKFKVVGIMEKTGTVDDTIYMPLDEMRDLFGDKESVSAIRVKLQDGQDMDDVAKSIENRLERARNDDLFEVFTPEQLLSQIGSILTIIQFILVGIAAISLLVGGVGIMNSMYTSVKERTRDIGIMKALGATNGKIAGMFLAEAGMIGSIGGILGIILGNMLAFSVEGIAKQFGFVLLSIRADYTLMLFALLFAFVVGMLSGLLPAVKAAKLVPVEALRYE